MFFFSVQCTFNFALENRNYVITMVSVTYVRYTTVLYDLPYGQPTRLFFFTKRLPENCVKNKIKILNNIRSFPLNARALFDNLTFGHSPTRISIQVPADNYRTNYTHVRGYYYFEDFILTGACNTNTLCNVRESKK